MAIQELAVLLQPRSEEGRAGGMRSLEGRGGWSQKLVPVQAWLLAPSIPTPVPVHPATRPLQLTCSRCMAMGSMRRCTCARR